MCVSVCFVFVDIFNVCDSCKSVAETDGSREACPYTEAETVHAEQSSFMLLKTNFATPKRTLTNPHRPTIA